MTASSFPVPVPFGTGKYYWNFSYRRFLFQFQKLERKYVNMLLVVNVFYPKFTNLDVRQWCLRHGQGRRTKPQQ